MIKPAEKIAYLYGFMHESFYKNNANDFTSKWFALANTLFSELIIKVDGTYHDLLYQN